MENDRDKNPDGRFLARWSRRKAGTETAAPPETGVVNPPDGTRDGNEIARRDGEPAGQSAQSTQSAQSETEPLTDAHMPPIDSLTEDSDFSGFLSPGVSEALRKRALRKLFAGAVFNIRDGLDDYDDDFRNFAALGDLITSDMKHQMEVEEARKRKAEAEAEETTPDEQQTGGDTPPAEASGTAEASEKAEAAEDAGETDTENADTDPAAREHQGRQARQEPQTRKKQPNKKSP